MSGGLAGISEDTRQHIQTLFERLQRDEDAKRASMTPEEYRRHTAERDIAYCRDRLNPEFQLFVQFPELLPDEATRDAYRSRIRDLEHFLATGSHIDEDDP